MGLDAIGSFETVINRSAFGTLDSVRIETRPSAEVVTLAYNTSCAVNPNQYRISVSLSHDFDFRRLTLVVAIPTLFEGRGRSRMASLNSTGRRHRPERFGTTRRPLAPRTATQMRTPDTHCSIHNKERCNAKPSRITPVDYTDHHRCSLESPTATLAQAVVV